ncbi:UTP11-like, U3 small nucleolar ribonucleoprotein [Phlyctochytrium planicorne]|nr:UTP11-like, U3 small nucleolar ribonucleoprotein [Phlyctochytrium planicorne]
MSSLRKSAPRKAHKERSQLQGRAHLGLLEKKKDYVLRAKDFKSKQKRLKSMREKAMTKNPDEFYFGMINAKTKDGVHVNANNHHRDKYDHDFLKLLKTQDQNYINYYRSINMSKLEKLKESLALDGVEELEKTTVVKPKTPGSHIIFVDDEDDAKNFNPEAYFAKKPKRRVDDDMDMLAEEEEEEEEENDDDGGDNQERNSKLDPKVMKQRESARKELASRKEREDKLRQMQKEMELQKNLMGKGSKKKVGKDSKGLAVYKWKMERKR